MTAGVAGSEMRVSAPKAFASRYKKMNLLLDLEGQRVIPAE
jgi:hypothetical protein